MYYIYRITNKINGKTYIGQHKYKKLNDSYMGSGKILKQSIKKYGIDNFEKEILYSRIQYKETADDMERFAIAKERAKGKAEYNIADGGTGNIGPRSEETIRKTAESNKGKHRTEKQKKKISEALKGHNVSEETRRKLSESRIGKPSCNRGRRHTDEARRHMSDGHKGKHHSDEQKQRLSEAMKGENNPMYGKHHSEEAKQKISESNKGKPSWNKGLKLGSNGRHWYNNGEINVLAKECPEGFVKGRLRVYH